MLPPVGAAAADTVPESAPGFAGAELLEAKNSDELVDEDSLKRLEGIDVILEDEALEEIGVLEVNKVVDGVEEKTVDEVAD